MSTQHHPSNASPLANQGSLLGKVSALQTMLSHEITSHYWVNSKTGRYYAAPRQVLYDNMKTVVLARDAYGQSQHRFHPGLWDFAKHHGFLPKLCAPYRAQTKGKVERFIHYLRHSFYVLYRSMLKPAGLQVDAPGANEAVRRWLLETANCREHRELRARPVDRWHAE